MSIGRHQRKFNHGFYLFVLFTSASILGGCGAMGTKALEVMTPEQRQYADEKLATITSDMTPHAVANILGPWYTQELDTRYAWLGPQGNDSSQIKIDFKNYTASRIRWVNPGEFVWVKKLDQ